MTSLSTFAIRVRAPLGCGALALATLLAACRDASRPTALEAAPGAPLAARGGSSTQGLPTGRLGVRTQTVDRTRYKIQYHNGPVMRGPVNVYYIWYGSWTGSTAPNVVTNLAASLGGSSYHAINTLYPQGTGDRPVNSVTFGGAIEDLYSFGASLERADLDSIVVRAINGQQLPLDPNGVYVVFGAADVTIGYLPRDGYESCRTFCGLHGYTILQGSEIKYAFVPNPERCPSQCAAQAVGPNGTLAGDAMASIVAALVSAAVTDPTLSSWYDRLGLENAGKCAWDFGPTYTAPNGAQANIQLGIRHYLLQRNWVPTRKGGYCATAAPEPGTLSAEDAAAEGE